MIVVDTSALMAVLLNEPEADECSEILIGQDMLVMSAGTLAEALVVADKRGLGSEMLALVEGLDVEIAAVTKRVAELVSEAYMRWGKGVHPAGLNFGDCFAYALAKSEDRPLLFVGNDFEKTDVSRTTLGEMAPQ
ncbi:MAG: type II toxin-antitoxin system VapC family toxin [Rhodobacteraceae bacterium]|nr:type II toxin-antitoxin system VapC family toxin [Paracoccaceae bacterium]MCY4141956.1 type II toxin-antitoxin system VapC family toxin [Paracoccaceae bacterium]